MYASFLFTIDIKIETNASHLVTVCYWQNAVCMHKELMFSNTLFRHCVATISVGSVFEKSKRFLTSRPLGTRPCKKVFLDYYKPLCIDQYRFA